MSNFLSFSIPKAKSPSLETFTIFLSIIILVLGFVLPIIKCPWINLPLNSTAFNWVKKKKKDDK